MKTQPTHRCLMCKRAMSNPESIARGIGPECAEKLAAALGACGISDAEMSVWEVTEGAARWARLVLKAIAAGNYRDARSFAEAARRNTPAQVVEAPVAPAAPVVEPVKAPAPGHRCLNQQSAWFYSPWLQVYGLAVAAATDGASLTITLRTKAESFSFHCAATEFKTNGDSARGVLHALGLRTLYEPLLVKRIIEAVTSARTLVAKFGQPEQECAYEILCSEQWAGVVETTRPTTLSTCF